MSFASSFPGKTFAMSKHLFSWNLWGTKQLYGQPMTEARTESESYLLPKAERTESLQQPRNAGKKCSNLILGVFAIFLWSFFAFSIGFLLANRRHTNNRGSFETGFAEERIVSK